MTDGIKSGRKELDQQLMRENRIHNKSKTYKKITANFITFTTGIVSLLSPTVPYVTVVTTDTSITAGLLFTTLNRVSFFITLTKVINI